MEFHRVILFSNSSKTENSVDFSSRSSFRPYTSVRATLIFSETCDFAKPSCFVVAKMKPNIIATIKISTQVFRQQYL
jgi:hypothetical protein